VALEETTKIAVSSAEISDGDSTITIKPSAATEETRNKPTHRIVCAPKERVPYGGGCNDTSGGIQGRWVPAPPGAITDSTTRRRDELQGDVCCGYPNPSKGVCDLEATTDGEAVWRGHPDLYTPVTARFSCSCVRQGWPLRYDWIGQPEVAPRSQWDAKETCALLGNRSVLFLGDSTMQQTWATLMNSLHPGGCQTQIMFMICDTLVKKKFGAMNRGLHWKTAVDMVKPDICILGLGGHIHLSKDGDSNYFAVLTEVFDDLKHYNDDKDRKVTFVYKTNQPQGCAESIFHPENPSLAATEYNASMSGVPLIEQRAAMYRFDWTYHRDLFAIRECETRGLNYMDMRMLYSRVDGHPSSRRAGADCAHFCAFGPLDDVVGPLFQKLLQDITAT